LVLAGIAIAYYAGLFALVAQPKTLADSLVAMGAWGYVLFVVAYTLLQPFGVPGTVFIVAAPLIWPWRRETASRPVFARNSRLQIGSDFFVGHRCRFRPHENPSFCEES
jgi:hypothetical protein